MNATDRRYHFKQVVIWGASESGRDCAMQLQAAGIEVLHFVDRNPPASGLFMGKRVVQTQDFLDQLGGAHAIDAVFLAMGIDLTPVRADLRAAGCPCPLLGFRVGGKVEELLKRRISPRWLLAPDDTMQNAALIDAIARPLLLQPALYILGTSAFAVQLCSRHPEIAARRIAVEAPAPAAVFIAELAHLAIHDLSQQLRACWPQTTLLTINALLPEIPDALIPSPAWSEPEYSIYPLEIPAIAVEPDLDMLLLDLPARFLGLLPNGLGYVHEILKRTGIRFQTLDMDMICYHRFHATRIIDGARATVSPAGYAMKSDPWAIDVVDDEWGKDEVLDYFAPEFERLVAEICRAQPKLLGISLHGTNLPLARRLMPRIRAASPGTKIIVGGYDCLNPEVGPRVFEDYDYMVIFEAEGSLETLVTQLASGRRPRNLPGIIGRDDIRALPFVPATLVEDLDTLGFPKYEWATLDLYRNYNGYQLIPIVLSRGCKWSRCTFCGERFHWRRRSASSVVDEIEWFVQRGATQFHFNDSDLSGDPNTVHELCEEIIRRKLNHISMIGQLRVQKGYTPEYFVTLKQAGFKSLRYGIDGWSKNTLKLHKKGYTLQMIEDVISMTKAAGIRVAINLVIGIPHETEEDIDETIDSIIRNRKNFDCIESINTLMLFAGSIYWERPEESGIRFTEPFEDLKKRYPKCIPTDYWHSEGPYIDQAIRAARLQRIIDAAAEHHIPLGAFANRRVRRILEGV